MKTVIDNWFCKMAVMSLLLAMSAGCATSSGTAGVNAPAKKQGSAPAVSGSAPQEQWATCSSHPDVRFRRGQACPKCGMHGGGMGGM